MLDYFDFKKFCGMMFTKIEVGEYDGNDAIFFHSDNDTSYVMTHVQDCCESVYIADVIGSFDDIIGSEIKIAYINSSEEEKDYSHYTYTFYTLATFKGAVTLRWNGSSNGYYSESCGVYKLEP